MTAVLWHIEVSHYSEKVRWALDYKGVPHERRAPMPGLHRARALMLTRGSHGRMPVLRLDGQTIGDSTAIIAALEEYQPDPPLYPASAGDRERALALEDYFDEEQAPRMRRFVFHHMLDDTDATLDAILPNAGSVRRGMLRAATPIARPLVRRDYDVGEATAAEALEGMRAAMDRIEGELGPSGYLVGDSFTVADLAAAALFTPLLAPPERPYLPARVAPAVMEVREELSARPGGAFVTEMYARHRGQSAAIPRR